MNKQTTNKRWDTQHTPNELCVPYNRLCFPCDSETDIDRGWQASAQLNLLFMRIEMFGYYIHS